MSSERKAVLSVAPTFEPVTLAEAKKQLEIAGAYTYHDQHIQSLITAAREVVEHDTGMVLCSSTWTLKLDSFDDDDIDLPIRPVQSISSITYVDTAGTTQTWSSSNYALDASQATPEIVLTYLSQYPTVRGDPMGITITFVAGYATEAAIPMPLKQACKLLLAHWFEQRTPVSTGQPGEIPETYTALIRRYMRPTYP